MASTSAHTATFCAVPGEGRYWASKRARGERLQEILAQIVAQQRKDEMRIEPTSRPEVGMRRQLVDMEQGFQPLEREFDLPPESVCGEYLRGGVALRRQRGT